MMIRVMGILSIISTFLLFSSCNQTIKSEKLSSNSVEEIQKNDIQMDSIIVKYWKNTEANEYHFFYKEGVLHISSVYFDLKRTIEDKHINNEFLTYINVLYVSKKPIVLSQKNEPVPITEYSTITAIGYFEEKKVFEEKTTLYSNLEFSTKFLEFYEFLDNLIKQK